MTNIIMTIYALCNIRVISVDRYTKESCIEHYTNCLVGLDGKFMEEKIDSCKLKWKKVKNESK